MQTPGQMQNVFGQSTDTERWIESFGVAYTLVEDLDIQWFDLDASLHNQARLEPLDEELVARYGEAMIAGAVFPAPVAYSKTNNKDNYVAVDGNHRLQAFMRRGGVTLCTYILDVDANDLVLLDMIASANANLNGITATDDDKRQHALRMIDRGATYDTASRLCGLRKADVQRAVRCDRVLRHSDHLGLGREAHHAPQWMLYALATHLDVLFPDDLRAFYNLPQKITDLKRDKFAAMLKEVVSTGDPSERAAVVESFIAANTAINAPRTTKARTSSPWAQFKVHSAAIVKFDAEQIIATCPPAQLETTLKLAEDLRYIASRLERTR